MPDLRDAVIAAGTSTMIRLNPIVYDLSDTLRIRNRTIIGDGAAIRHTASSDRENSAIVLRGTGPRLLGNVTLIGSMPSGNGYVASKEGQHGVQVDGAISPEIGGWHIRNFYGDGVTFGTVDHKAGQPWTKNAYLHDVTFDEIGRHAWNVDALDGGRFARLNIGRVNMAIGDIEPPGAQWGCKYLTWSDSDIRDTGGGFVLANKGVGVTGSVHDIVLDGIRCPRRLFNVQVNPPAGVRRHDYTFRNCLGGERAENSPLNFRRADHVTVENVDQPMLAGVPLIFQENCTDITHDGEVIVP